MTFSALILAGGESRRMGRDKAWIELEGKPLVAVALEKIRRLGIEEISISGRDTVDYSGLNCPVLLDNQPGLGPLGGIERGLEVCRTSLLLVLAVDMPRVTSEFLQELLGQCNLTTGAVPSLPGGLEPLAAVYPKRCHEIARAAIQSSRLSARGFAEICHRDQIVRCWPVPANQSGFFSNWNRPEDLPVR